MLNFNLLSRSGVSNLEFLNSDTGIEMCLVLGITMLCTGDVINELLVHDRAAVCVWLETAVRNLQQLGTATPVVTRKQLVDFHQSVMAAEGSSDVSHALREFSRQVCSWI